MRDFTHFEEFPAQIMKSCTEANYLGNPLDCKVNQGWHANNQQRLASNTKANGIPPGIKFSMKEIIYLTNPYGGWLDISYRMRGFQNFEEFRILINGQLQLSENQDTGISQNVFFDPVNEREEDRDFVNFISDNIPFGYNSIEISAISNLEGNLDQYEGVPQDFVSKAHVEIKRMTFYGAETGGASEC